MPTQIFISDKGQVGVFFEGQNAPANTKLIWRHIDAGNALIDYKIFKSGQWTSITIVQVLDVFTSFSKVDAASANTVRQLKAWTDQNAAAISQLALDITNNFQLLNEKNQANGYAGLDASGKIPAALLNVSGLIPKGDWDANTGQAPSNSPQDGWMYSVSVAGNTDLNGINVWAEGDFAYYGGSRWNKIEGFNPVIIDNLTQATPGLALDARQGKILKDLYDALLIAHNALDVRVTQTETDITNLISATQQNASDISDRQKTIIRHFLTADANAQVVHADLSGVQLTDVEIYVGDTMVNSLATKASPVSNTIQLQAFQKNKAVYLKIYPV